MLTTLILTALAHGGPASAPRLAQSEIREIHRTEVAQDTGGLRVVFDANGVRRGLSEHSLLGSRLFLDSGANFDLTDERGAFFRFTLSNDERTLLTQGDPAAIEHPLSLVARIYRDGQRVFQLDHPVAPDSVLRLSSSGSGLFLYPASPGSEEWMLTVFDAATAQRRDVALPVGKRGADPVLVDDIVYFRMFEALDETASSLVAFDGSGIREVASIPGTLELVQPRGFDALLLRSGTALTAFDPATETFIWLLEADLRPRSPFSWAASDDGQRLAVLTIDRQRRGEQPKTEVIRIIDGESGSLLASQPVTGIPRSILPRLHWSDDLQIDWAGGSATFEVR